jgi:hypothetical protein
MEYRGPSLRPYEPSFWDMLAQRAMGDSRSPYRRRVVEGILGTSGLGDTDDLSVRGLTVPETPADAALMALGPAARYGGQAAAKAVGAATGALFGMESSDAEAGILGSSRKGARNVVQRIGDTFSRTAEDSAGAAAMRPPGAAPDRTPGTLPRFDAPRGTSARLSRLLDRLDNDPAMTAEFRDIAEAGRKLTGMDWYNTEGLRSRFTEVLGPDQGANAWREYMHLVGATSPGQAVYPNIRSASYWFTQDPAEMRQRLDDFAAKKMVPPKGSGYGSQTQQYQSQLLGQHYSDNFLNNPDPTSAPKPRGFTQSLMGNPENIAADKHFVRLLSMLSNDADFLHGSAQISNKLANELKDQFGADKYVRYRTVNGKEVPFVNAKKLVREHENGPKIFERFKNEPTVWQDMPEDNEYKAFEQFTNKLAKELGMTAPQLQASLWVGGAARTGVDPSSLNTFEQIFNKVVQDRAAERGLSEDEVVRRFLTRQQPLAVPLAAGAAGYGLLGGGPEDRSQ